MREIILKTKLENPSWSFKRIAETVGCTDGTVSYYLSPNAKKRKIERACRVKEGLIQMLKNELGGCCSICNYKKCSKALEFHHLNVKDKKGNVSRIANNGNLNKAREEAKKCILLCANCHREFHEGLIDISKQPQEAN